MINRRKRIDTIEEQIAGIKKKIGRIGCLRYGSLSEQYNVCGSSGCKCKASPPQKHGPYYQLSFTRNGRSTTKSVNRKDAKIVKKHVNNYTRLKKLIENWVELGTELSGLEINEND